MTLAELRAWIVGRLDPIAGFDPAARAAGAGQADALGLGVRGVLAPAAVLIGLIEREAEVSVLLTRRADTLRRHTGQIAFPGGRCEPGETPWETALREAQEEVGLDPGFVELAGLSSSFQTGTGFDVTPVVGFLRPGFSLMRNPGEVAEIFEAPFAFLMDPGNHEQRFMEVAEGVSRQFYAMPYRERLIWGATAGMLRVLYERLYGAKAA